MDSSGSQDTGRNGGRRSGKRPQQMKFMFIDSNDQGSNAKPNKEVRSFVMHQARRSKPWSTRQRQSQTPISERSPTARPFGPHRSASQAHHRAEPTSPVELGHWQELDSKPNAWNAQAPGSPVSSVGSNSANSRQGSQPCSTPTSSHGSACDRLDCNGEPCGLTHMALARRDGLALGVLDPFDSLVVRTDAKTSSMLEHFVSIISPRLIPVDLHQSSNIATTQWVANSLRNTTSAPFTYALLTSSALHLQALGVASLEDVLYYKSRAISEINTLLSDQKTSIDDSNIAAVFMLLCLEESQLAPNNKTEDDAWNEMQRSIHLNGLRAMIQQRGGLSALSSNRCLQIFLLMHSIAHSISTFQRPYATLLDSTGQPQKYDIPSFRQRPASARTLRLFRDLKLDADLYDIISNIVVYTGDISSWFEDRKCPLDPLELQKHACLLNYRLLDWYTSPSEGEDVQDRNPIDQSICLALIIFVVMITHPFDPSYRATILTTVKKLRTSLNKGSVLRWAKAPDLLLWTLTMGTLAAQGSPEYSFFTQYCSMAFGEAGFGEKTNADELLDRMRKCLWIPMLLDEDVKKLWVQMGLAKGDVVECKREDEEEEGLLSPEIKEDDIVGLLTSTRFFSTDKKR